MFRNLLVAFALVLAAPAVKANEVEDLEFVADDVVEFRIAAGTDKTPDETGLTLLRTTVAVEEFPEERLPGALLFTCVAVERPDDPGADTLRRHRLGEAVERIKVLVATCRAA